MGTLVYDLFTDRLRREISQCLEGFGVETKQLTIDRDLGVSVELVLVSGFSMAEDRDTSAS